MPSVLGFAAHWTWIWCVFWSTLFYRESDFFASLPGNLFSLEPLWTVSLLSNVITLLLLIVLCSLRRPLGAIKALPLLAAVVTAAGTLLISHPVLLFMGGAAAVMYPLGSVLTGIGSAAVVVLWGELFTTLGARHAISNSVAALLVGCIAYLLIMLLPSGVAQVITALFPPASIFFFLRFKRSMPRKEREKRGKGLMLYRNVPLGLIGISLFFGASFGIMKGLFVMNGGGLIEMRNLLNILAVALGSIAIYATTHTFRMDFDHLTYQIALPLMAAGFIFIPLHDPFNIMGTAVHQFGYQYFYIVLWALWPVLARRGGVPEGWVVCWGMASIQLGQLVGSISSAGLSRLVSSDFDLAMVSALAIFVILLISLFALGNRPADTGWGFLKPIEEAVYANPFERSCIQTARSYNLSPRETEVFFLLVKGRNRSYISEELVVSDETVKTHIKNIYRKAGVHSKQEMLDLVEQEEQGLL
jgi:DNA-binding CsgD family transcriptional regulator